MCGQKQYFHIWSISFYKNTTATTNNNNNNNFQEDNIFGTRVSLTYGSQLQ